MFRKFFWSCKIFFSFSKRLKVGLTYNAKPENESHKEWLTHLQNNAINASSSLSINDMFAEWDTIETINAVANALSKFNDVTMIEADFNAYEKLKSIKPDIVFNIAEGLYGVSREAQIPAMLEMLNIPYSGSDALTLATCLDKGRTKEILGYYKIPTSKFFIASSNNGVSHNSFKYPLIVKPNAEGSSKGIYSSSFVKSYDELISEVKRINNEYNSDALIEEFLPGREFTVALIGNGNEVEVLPIIEIKYSDFPENFIPIYSFEAKWILDTKENPLDVFSCPAEISSSLKNEIETICKKTYSILRCRDWARIDLRLDANGTPNIIEINPLPGILPDPKDNSCYPKAARTAGMDYTTMLNRVLYEAAKRYNLV